MPESNYANMTDEEISAINPESFNNSDSEEEIETVEEEIVSEENNEAEDIATSEENLEEDQEENTEETSLEEEKQEQEQEEEEPLEENSSEDVSSYKEQLDKFFQPFKANGRDIKIDTPEEGIALMQKGVDYTRKMQTLKPYLKVMQSLKDHDLLDQSKINNFIDLSKKDPKAISNFLRESGIDPLQIDIDEGDSYKPNDYSVSDNTMALSEIVRNYENDPEAITVFDEIKNTWDDSSKNNLFNNPADLQALINHKKSGYYEQVMTRLQKARSLGQIDANMPMAQAYLLVGQTIDRENSLNNPQRNIQTSIAQRKIVPDNVKNNASSQAKSASITRKTKPYKKQIDINALSDEDFEKISFRDLT